MTTYDLDFHAWANEQAEALRRRSANEIDWDNVAEEIESLGKTEARELYSRLVVLLTHLLKWRFQPEGQGNSWRGTINEQRRAILKHLRENPSLSAREDQEFTDAYEAARARASADTGLDDEVFPERPPFTLEKAKADDFWPEPPPTSS